MKYIKTLMASLVAVALLSATAVYAADTQLTTSSTGYTPGPWTFSLSGAGSSALDQARLTRSTVGGEFEIGHDGNFVLPFNAGIRQSIGYSDATADQWALSTKVYSDWTLIKLGSLEADAGGNVGLSYGSQVGDWTAAPEVVARLYLTKYADVFGRVEYPFDLNTAKDLHTLVYAIGLRVRF